MSLTGALPDNRPIGIFDSGIGGLTVLRSLLDSLPNENFVYLGDTARLPYGSKSPQTIARYLKMNVEFLQTYNVKCIVVACNSASTVLLDPAFSEVTRTSLPVFNVITPSAHWAAQHSRAKRIGVLGTRATVQSGAYAKALSHAAPGAFVCSQACPLLVPLVEEGWEDDPITNLIVYRYVQPLLMQNIDTLILGCTHYPALRCSIEKVAGRGVDIVESGPAMSEVLLTTITSSQSQTEPRVQFLTTDASAGFMQAAARLLAPHPVARWQAVDTEKP